MKSFALFMVLLHLFGCATTVPVKPPVSDLDVPTGQIQKP